MTTLSWLLSFMEPVCSSGTFFFFFHVWYHWSLWTEPRLLNIKVWPDFFDNDVLRTLGQQHKKSEPYCFG